jgi:hypothetical protein
LFHPDGVVNDVADGRIVVPQSGADVPEREHRGVEQAAGGHRVPQVERMREMRVDVGHLFLVE